MLIKVDLYKILILYTSCKGAKLNLKVIPEENVKPIDNKVNSSMIFSNVDTLQDSLLLVIHLLFLNGIVDPVLIVVNGRLSLLMVGNSLFNLMSIEALSVAVILSLVLFENLDADIHLVIDDKLEVDLILEVLELRCVDPLNFFSLVLPTVLEEILSDVLNNVYFLLHLKLEYGDLQDVDGHILLNHLLICQVRQFFNVVI